MGKRKRELVSDANSPDGLRRGSDLHDRSAVKTRRSGVQRAAVNVNTQIDSDNDSTDNESGFPERCRKLRHIKAGELAFPRSAYQGYEPPLPVTSEFEALQDFKVIVDQQRRQASEQPDYDFIVLEAFSAYRHPRDARRPGELAGLEKLEVDRGAIEGLVFDGILRLGDTRRYVQGVPFKTITVDGYGDANITALTHRICIQSKQAKYFHIWYQLGRASKEYARFYEPFVWLAEFTKHFIDYLLEMGSVTLEDFRFCFHGWLCARHESDPHFQQWLQTCNLRDFRTTVAAHVPYLWKECSGLDEASLLEHPVWTEVHPYNLNAIEEQPNREKRTVVTPFVHGMFKHMYFHEQLDPRDVANEEICRRIDTTKAELGLTPYGAKRLRNTAMLTPNTQRSSPAVSGPIVISKGDVICLDADTEGEWKSASNTWYAYVQDVHVNEHTQKTTLDVLWLYEPHDTTLGAALYPFENELFLSDNCACGRDAINARDVTGKVAHVSWFATDPTSENGLFVRQKFRTAHDEGTDDFVSLQASDFQCRCGSKLTDFEDCRMKYDIGDTVLVKTYGEQGHDTRLDPALILDFDLTTERVVLGQLRRQSEMSNEVMLTDVVHTKPPGHLIRKCHVRKFERDVVAAGLPAGYDRGGAGDFYYIVEDPGKRSTALPAMTEGLDLVAPPDFEKLIGLGIFCGGGNFDRGLEDGGAVDFKYAVDWAEKALYTYRANSREPGAVHCFLGSVNDYLSRAMNGDKDAIIAVPGGIGLVTAGSPCPGFSNLQRDKASDDSLRNASMVASVVSYVDMFCPKYCILENVVAMTSCMGGDKDQNVFAQIIASFVAMGYQVQQFLTDAWLHGSSQSRSRVFIVASAPGLEPLPLPQISHDHPGADVRLHALGKASNGRSFGLRRNEYTPFRCISASDATADLPDIGDAQSRVCPAFPDHCTSSEEDAEARERIASVPIRPYGMGLAEGVRQGLVSGKPREWLLRGSSMKRGHGSKSYSRVRPNALFPAVTTGQKLACGFTGRTMHWSQNRSMTVLELRRAMGFLDHEPIIGSPRQQVVIIGNSVDRKVSFALGLCLRGSRAKSNASRRLTQTRTHAALVSPLPTEDDDNGSERGSSEQRSIPNVLSDMLRAGAYALDGLDTAERIALQTSDMGSASSSQALPNRAAMKVVDLTADQSEEDEGSEEAGGLSGGGGLVERPTAYVEIE